MHSRPAASCFGVLDAEVRFIARGHHAAAARGDRSEEDAQNDQSAHEPWSRMWGFADAGMAPSAGSNIQPALCVIPTTASADRHSQNISESRGVWLRHAR